MSHTSSTLRRDLLASEQLWAISGLTEKIALALIGGVIGFLASYFLDRIKAHREPRRRISWDATTQRALIEVSPGIRSKVRVLYEESEVTKLTHLRCTVVNSGNRVIKDHQVRFPMPNGARLLEEYLDPPPDPELGVELLGKDTIDGATQCRYHIAHLERNESITFNFVTAGGEFRDWRPRSFNKEGDVEFQRRDASFDKEDQEHVPPFLLISFLAVAVPGALQSLNFGTSTNLLLFTIRAAFLTGLLPHVRPVIRVIDRLITHYLRSRGWTTTNIVHSSGANVVQAATIQGGISIGQEHEAGSSDGDNSGPSLDVNESADEVATHGPN